MVTLTSGHLLLPPGDRWLDSLFATIIKRYPERPPVMIENAPVHGQLYE